MLITIWTKRDWRSFVKAKARHLLILVGVAPLILVSFASTAVTSQLADPVLEALGWDGQGVRTALTGLGLVTPIGVGLEPFWAGYLDEVIEMVDACWEMIQVVGHLDLPKVYAPVPEPLRDLERSSHALDDPGCHHVPGVKPRL